MNNTIKNLVILPIYLSLVFSVTLASISYWISIPLESIAPRVFHMTVNIVFIGVLLCGIVALVKYNPDKK